MSAEHADFYVRYYVGHKGKFGHEFLEFEFRPDGKVRACGGGAAAAAAAAAAERSRSALICDSSRRADAHAESHAADTAEQLA